MNCENYLKVFAVSIFCFVLFVVVVNFVVDPYDIKIFTRSLNIQKPDLPIYNRLHKSFSVFNTRPKSVILGTSVTEFGIDPAHPGFGAGNAPVYNLALNGARISEMYDALACSLSVGKVRSAVIGLDFYNFNIYHEQAPNAQSFQCVDNKLSGIFYYASADAFKSSVNSLVKAMSCNSQSDGRSVEQPILPNGLQSSSFRYASVARDRGYHYLFLSSEKGYIARGYKFYPYWSYSLKDERTGRSTLDAFRALLKLARDEHVELFLFLSPAHARHWETIRVTGLQSQFEEWKRGLVRVLEEDSSAHPNERRNVLWDFTGYNSISTEAVPSVDNREESMSWFWDSAHYKKELGDIILDKIFGYQDKYRKNPNDFGVVLSSNNIEENIHMFNDGQKTYHKTNQLDVLEIENIAKSLQSSSI